MGGKGSGRKTGSKNRKGTSKKKILTKNEIKSMTPPRYEIPEGYKTISLAEKLRQDEEYRAKLIAEAEAERQAEKEEREKKKEAEKEKKERLREQNKEDRERLKEWKSYHKRMESALNTTSMEAANAIPEVFSEEPPPMPRSVRREQARQLEAVSNRVEELISDEMMDEFIDSADKDLGDAELGAILPSVKEDADTETVDEKLDINRLFFESIQAEREYILTDMPTDEFISDYVYIESKDDPTDPVIKFEMWEGQRTALREMEDNRLNIILKARQLGFTWLCLSYFVHLVLKYPGYKVIALSETEDKSKELINRCDLILSQLPEWLIVPEKKYKDFEKTNGKGTYKGLFYRKGVLKLEIVRAEREDEAHTSSIIVQPATEGAGRSLTADIVFFDEWAFHKWAEKIFTAAYPTMARPTSGKFIGLSTNKRGTLYEDIWRHAEDRGFHKIFRNCFTDPRRDEEWYEKTAATMRGKMQQEFPRTEEEALSAGENVSFPEFSEEIHVCEPFEIPQHWKRWASVDNGYNDPFAWYKFAVSEDGTVYIYYEYSRWREEPKVIYSDQAAIFANSMIYRNSFSNMLDFEKLDYIVAGKDAWNQHHRDSSGKNLIDYYREGGLTRVGFIPAITDRKMRKAVAHEYLKPYVDENTGRLTAKLQIFNTCKYLITIMPQLVNDERDPEKVADLSDIDNCYDSAFYGLLSYHAKVSKPQKHDNRAAHVKYRDKIASRANRNKRRGRY